VHEIIGPLVKLKAPELLMFTRMTGDLVKAMRTCPQPIVAAVDGVCAGAGAILAMASDLRLGTARSKTAFLFKPCRPGRLRHGRVRDAAAHHRPGPRERAAVHRPCARWRGGRALGLVQPPRRARGPAAAAQALARELAAGPTFANGITKTMLHQEWAMTIEQAIEAEAQAQAICMLTEDFSRAYRAFVAKQKPRFEGN
jgi:enoyl-CoA hydratase/carnithine racemase